MTEVTPIQVRHGERVWITFLPWPNHKNKPEFVKEWFGVRRARPGKRVKAFVQRKVQMIESWVVG